MQLALPQAARLGAEQIAGRAGSADAVRLRLRPRDGDGEKWGKSAWRLTTLADMEALFDGIAIEKVKRIGTLGNSIGPIVLAMFAAMGERRGLKRPTNGQPAERSAQGIHRARNPDPAAAPAAQLAADCVAWCVDHAPGWSPMTVCVEPHQCRRRGVQPRHRDRAGQCDSLHRAVAPNGLFDRSGGAAAAHVPGRAARFLHRGRQPARAAPDLGAPDEGALRLDTARSHGACARPSMATARRHCRSRSTTSRASASARWLCAGWRLLRLHRLLRRGGIDADRESIGSRCAPANHRERAWLHRHHRSAGGSYFVETPDQARSSADPGRRCTRSNRPAVRLAVIDRRSGPAVDGRRRGPAPARRGMRRPALGHREQVAAAAGCASTRAFRIDPGSVHSAARAAGAGQGAARPERVAAALAAIDAACRSGANMVPADACGREGIRHGRRDLRSLARTLTAFSHRLPIFERDMHESTSKQDSRPDCQGRPGRPRRRRPRDRARPARCRHGGDLHGPAPHARADRARRAGGRCGRGRRQHPVGRAPHTAAQDAPPARRAGAEDIGLIAGGVIPQEDIPSRSQAGVQRVFLSGTTMQEIVEYIGGTTALRNDTVPALGASAAQAAHRVRRTRPCLVARGPALDLRRILDERSSAGAGLAARLPAGARVGLFMANRAEYMLLQFASNARDSCVCRSTCASRATRWPVLGRIAAPPRSSTTAHGRPIAPSPRVCRSSGVARSIASDADRTAWPTLLEGGPGGTNNVRRPRSTTSARSTTPPALPGKPKGVMLTHRNWSACTRNMLIDRDMRRDESWPRRPADSCQRHYFVPWFLRGACNVIVEGGTVDGLLEAIARERVDVFTCVPTVLTRIVNHPRMDGSTFAACARSATAQSRYRSTRWKRRCDRFGPHPDAELRPDRGDDDGDVAAGRTNISRYAGRVRVWAARRLHRPAIHVRGGRVARRAGRPECRRRRDRRDHVRSEHMTSGYWNRPEETAKVLRDGWLWTGDLGACETQGFITMAGRSKDMLISGGFNIYPAELEAVLTNHPRWWRRRCSACPTPTGARSRWPSSRRRRGQARRRPLKATARVLGFRSPRHSSFSRCCPRPPTARSTNQAQDEALKRGGGPWLIRGRHRGGSRRAHAVRPFRRRFKSLDAPRLGALAIDDACGALGFPEPSMPCMAASA